MFGVKISPTTFYPNMGDAGWKLKPRVFQVEIAILEQEDFNNPKKRISGEFLAQIWNDKKFPLGQILAQVLIQNGEKIPITLIDLPIYFPDTVWIDDEGKDRAPFIFCSNKEKKWWTMKWYDTFEFLPKKFGVVRDIKAENR